MNKQERYELVINILAEKSGVLFAAEDVDAVYRAAGALLSDEIGLLCAVFAVEGYVLALKYVSISEKLISLAKRMTGLDAHNFTMSQEDVIVFETLRHTHEPVFLADIRDITRVTLDKIYKQRPGMQMYLVKGISGIMQFISDNVFPFMNKKIISAPVVVDGQVEGVFHVFGEDLSSEYIPAVGAYCNVVAAAVSQKKLEASLRELDARYRNTLDAVPHIVLETDLQGRITYANPAALSLLGDAVLGAGILDFIPDNDRALENLIFGKRADTAHEEAKARIIAKSGEHRELLLRVAPIRSNGEPSGATIFGVDTENTVRMKT